MNRGFGILRVAAALLLLLGASLARAQEARIHPGIDRYLETADRFDRHAATIAPRGAPPRLTEAESRDLLAVLTDSPAVFGGEHFNAADIELLQGTIIRSTGVLMYYLQFGIPSGANLDTDPRVDRNALLYQDEVAPLISFLIDGLAVFVQVNVDFTRESGAALTAEQRQIGLTMRRNVENTLRNFVLAAAADGVRPENRLLMARSFSRNRATFAAALSPSQRGGLVTVANRARPRVGPAARAEVDALIAALRNAPCDALCAL